MLLECLYFRGLDRRLTCNDSADFRSYTPEMSEDSFTCTQVTGLTGSVLSNYTINILSLHGIHDPV